MDVHEQFNLAALQRLSNHVLHAEDLRRVPETGAHPLSIQVVATEAASVVANNDAVRVQHRNNFEDELVSKDQGLELVTHEEFDCTFHNEA
eukprot:CAMPEP_0170497566 /NCGR_PEP_ID=MMETSP0208-20121228/25058_1 /TAXON_ID=197538 /ORGANISM="Strombidium inclinatum, Strain S3" /LENGTH=90 /DNA_ID=CAMNT_0010774421 /DNA_START=2323 /DNA_END=2595 /DNA_ORIENTATION=+